MEDSLIKSTVAESANAVAVAEEARLKAIASQLIALQAEATEKVANVVATTMKEGFRYAFTTDTGEIRKFVDSSQVHRICDDIERNRKATESIDKQIQLWESNRVTKTDFLLLKQQSDLTNKIVLGAVALILTAVTGTILGLVLIH